MNRLAAAVLRRVRGPYASLGRLDARLAALAARSAEVDARWAEVDARWAEVDARWAEVDARWAEVDARLTGIERKLAELADRQRAAAERSKETHHLLEGEIRTVLKRLVAEETENRRRLHRLRADPEYPLAWTDPLPLVSVTVATRERPRLLAQRSLPSILAQTYTNLEVIVVGDHADHATAEAVRSLGDPRLVYRNLTQRLHFTDDPHKQWLVASTMARNEAIRLCRGRWLVSFDDDDAMRPKCIETLLARARADRLEAVYGRAMVHGTGHNAFAIGCFPPRLGHFTWASGMYHAGLAFLGRELFAADLGLPGDWFLVERMLRAGARFGMADSVLADIHPSPRNGIRPS
jgi:Glycosyl transferase family 2